jgi:hypothetical protein
LFAIPIAFVNVIASATASALAAGCVPMSSNFRMSARFDSSEAWSGQRSGIFSRRT